MIGSMRRSEAVSSGTMIDQQPYMYKEFRVAAGAQSLNAIFKNPAADYISKGNRTNKKERPPPALAFEINRDEQE